MNDIIIALEKIESEIHDLKMKLKAQSKPLKLKGVWKGVEITEEDIEEAKKSLFKNVYKYNGE